MSTQTDNAGQIYIPPTSDPVIYGTPVKIPNGSGGTTGGTMGPGGIVVPNKK